MSTQKSTFCLVGQLKSYELGKSGKVRYLRLETLQGLQAVKLKKSSSLALLQETFSELVYQSLWVEVSGQQKLDLDGTQKSFKAETLKILEQSPDLELSPPEAKDPDPSLAKVHRAASPKILICQKSSCRKRGSAAVQRALEQALDDRQLSEQVSVRATGCLKHCSKGPNLVINKKSYRGVSVKDLPDLLDQHFSPAPVESQPAAMIESV